MRKNKSDITIAAFKERRGTDVTSVLHVAALCSSLRSRHVFTSPFQQPRQETRDSVTYFDFLNSIPIHLILSDKTSR